MKIKFFVFLSILSSDYFSQDYSIIKTQCGLGALSYEYISEKWKGRKRRLVILKVGLSANINQLQGLVCRLQNHFLYRGCCTQNERIETRPFGHYRSVRCRCHLCLCFIQVSLDCMYWIYVNVYPCETCSGCHNVCKIKWLVYETLTY
jgi:hypothetical protein